MQYKLTARVPTFVEHEIWFECDPTSSPSVTNKLADMIRADATPTQIKRVACVTDVNTRQEPRSPAEAQLELKVYK